MRLIRPVLLAALALHTGSKTVAAQVPASVPPTAKPVVAKKLPSRAAAIATKLADTAATATAAMATDSLLGEKGKSVANSLGIGGQPCASALAGVAPGGVLPGLGGMSAGVAMVGAAKKALLKKKGDTSAVRPVTAAPCPAAQLSASPATVAAPAPTLPGGMSPMSAVAMASPIGMAVVAAPYAGQAVKGIKGMLAGKGQDKIAMLRDLGKGRLELKDVKFIEGTAEMEPGFEASFARVGEAIALAEGRYILHVPAEAGEKGAAPDTALARKRILKAWAAILVNGVSDQRIVAVAVLSPELSAGRKPPKPGEARVELIRLPEQP